MSHVAIDQELARLAAGRLDSLADGLEGGMQDSYAALRPAAAGLDPVSIRTSQTFSEVGGSFRESYLSGVRELRKIAANLRSHADLAEGAESNNAQLFHL